MTPPRHPQGKPTMQDIRPFSRKAKRPTKLAKSKLLKSVRDALYEARNRRPFPGQYDEFRGLGAAPLIEEFFKKYYAAKLNQYGRFDIEQPIGDTVDHVVGSLYRRRKKTTKEFPQVDWWEFMARIMIALVYLDLNDVPVTHTDQGLLDVFDSI